MSDHSSAAAWAQWQDGVEALFSSAGGKQLRVRDVEEGDVTVRSVYGVFPLCHAHRLQEALRCAPTPVLNRGVFLPLLSCLVAPDCTHIFLCHDLPLHSHMLLFVSLGFFRYEI